MVYREISGRPLTSSNSLLLQAAILHAITVKKVTPFSLSRATPSLGKLSFQNEKL